MMMSYTPIAQSRRESLKSPVGRGEESTRK